MEAHFLTIIDMNELAGSWQPKVIFYMYWYDERLEYQNLKEDDNLNILTEEERDAVWLPTGFTTLRLVVLIAPPKNGLKWFEILHKDILG